MKPGEVSPSRPQPPSADDQGPTSTVDVPREDDNVPPSVLVAVSRRKWLIVGALAVAALWVVATGGRFDRHQAPIVSAAGSGAGSPSPSGAARPSAVGRETEARVEEIGDVTSAPVRSPDGNRIVFGARGGTLYLLDLRSDRSSWVVRLPGQNLDSVDDIEWSPDGEYLAIMNDLEPGGGRLYVMNSHGFRVRVILDNYVPGGLAWSPDGRLLAYATLGVDEPDRLWTISPIKGVPSAVTTGTHISDPVWSPDGSHIAFVGSTRGGRGWYVVAADGTGPRVEIGRFTYLDWRGSSQD